MNQRHPGAASSSNGLFPETMSEYFRPTSSLPHWEQASNSQVYSNVSMNSTHEQDIDIASAMKSDQDTHSVHSDHYDTFTSGSGNSEEHVSYPITPPVSDQCPAGRELTHQDHDDDTDEPPKKKRVPVPVEKKDNKYWDRRKKNNQAAKRSRDSRKKRIDEEIKSAKDAIVENQKLKQEIDVLKAEINSLRRLLKDANMTLSLWIKARQASEPNAQLPPMLRGPNLSFVNFPVTTTM